MTASALLALILPVLQAQAGELTIANPRGTYGHLGAPVPKGTARLPGDVIHFAFDILNMKLDAKGQASYSMLYEIYDPKGQLVYKEGPINALAINCLGGGALPCTAHFELPTDAVPGIYSAKAVVHDRISNKKVTFESKGQVAPAGFGLIRLGTSSDRAGNAPIPPIGVVGQVLYVNFSTVGFARDKKNNQPDIEASLRIVDSKGQPTMPAPLAGKTNDGVPDSLPIIPMQFAVTLNRAGDFTLELSATDAIAGKTSKISLPIRVIAAP